MGDPGKSARADEPGEEEEAGIGVETDADDGEDGEGEEGHGREGGREGGKRGGYEFARVNVQRLSEPLSRLTKSKARSLIRISAKA